MMRAFLQRLTLPMVLTYAGLLAVLLLLFAMRPAGVTLDPEAAQAGFDTDVTQPVTPDYAQALTRLRSAGFFPLEGPKLGEAVATDEGDAAALPRLAGVVTEDETYALLYGPSGLERVSVGETFGDYKLISLNAVEAQFTDENGDIVTVKLYSSS